MTTAPRWLTLFLDVPDANHEAGCTFWQAATGYQTSPPRGERDEFATLLPPAGDAHLRIQSTRIGDFRLHLDLHVDDLEAAVEHAVTVGADLVAKPGHAILRSPAGFVFDHPDTLTSRNNLAGVGRPLTVEPVPGQWKCRRLSRLGISQPATRGSWSGSARVGFRYPMGDSPTGCPPAALGLTLHNANTLTALGPQIQWIGRQLLDAISSVEGPQRISVTIGGSDVAGNRQLRSSASIVLAPERNP